MNTVTAINTVRDRLRTLLTDPKVTAGSINSRTWIWSDEPIVGASYPMIQFKKISNPTENISIGSDYWEHEQVFISIWFYTKNGFKINVSGTEYTNAQLVEYYLGLIKNTLKDDFNNLFTAGVGGYRNMDTSSIEYDEKTQLYYGNVVSRVWFFRQ